MTSLFFAIRKQWVSELVYSASENQSMFGVTPPQDRQLFSVLTLAYACFLLASKHGSETWISRV